jgi:hypothetical protein
MEFMCFCLEKNVFQFTKRKTNNECFSAVCLLEKNICLSARLHGQTLQQFQLGNDQFEDISLGSQRPAELIRRYGELYTDGRVETLDALDRLVPLKGLDVLKLKILFSVVVVSMVERSHHYFISFNTPPIPHHHPIKEVI